MRSSATGCSPSAAKGRREALHGRHAADLDARARAGRLLLLALALPALGPAARAQGWPGGSGVEIGGVGQPGGLPTGFEPSGAAWHAGRQELVVVGDGGRVAAMDRDGQQVTVWTVFGDLESVAVADPLSTLVYLGHEKPEMVLELDLATGLLTGEQWNLTPWMGSSSDQGLEGLTFADGLFLAGRQSDGRIFRFDLQPGGVVVPGGTFASHLGPDDLSGLHYEPEADVLYAIHDGHDVIVEYDGQDVFLREYSLPGDNQEGVALAPCCPGGAASVFLAEDSGQA